MHVWLFLLVVLAALKTTTQVASTPYLVNKISNNKYLNNSKNNSNNNNNKNNNNIKSNNSHNKIESKTMEIIEQNSESKLKPDRESLVQIEKGLLTMFGFSKAPKIDRSKIVIPDFMKLLYAEMTGQQLNLETNSKTQKRQQSNTVRSFTHQYSKIDDRFKHHNKFRLYFDTSSIPKDEKMRGAELFIQRDAILHPLANKTRYKILAYDIVRPGIKDKRDPIFRLVDSKEVFINGTKEITLDVRPAVERWITAGNKNHGLLIQVTVGNNLKIAQHKHIRLRRSLDEPYENWSRKQPILYAYTDDGRFKHRTIDDSNRSKRASHHRRTHRRKDGREICHRRPLYVDFSDVGWNDWIVAPPGYDAYYCQGDCPFPLADHLNSTNHAVVQTLVNNINPSKVPKACCVPTQLTAISMLYLNDQNTVVLKNYQDMAVVGCGCR